MEVSVQLVPEKRIEETGRDRNQIRYVTAGDINLDQISDAFPRLSIGMAYEGAMLHPSDTRLQASFTDGDAVVGLDTNRNHAPIGYARLEPLLTERLRSLLGIDAACPTIMEAGSMFISPEQHYRGQGHLTELCTALFGTRQNQIDLEHLLVIGTTKHLAVLKSLDSCGVGDFIPCHHLEYPHLAALTCICSGKMGTGFQSSLSCSERLDRSVEIDSGNLQNLPRSGTKIPCTMFVSSRSLAERADRAIARAFETGMDTDSVNALRARLKEIGHYPVASAGHGTPQSVTLTVAGVPV